MSRERRWRWRLEFLLAKSLLALLRVLPQGMCFWVAARLGDLLRVLLRERRRIAAANIARALGFDENDPKTQAIVRDSFRHFLLVPVELFLLDKALNEKNVEEVLAVDRPEVLDGIVEAGRGGIFVTGHLGNWEVMGALAGQRGYPLASVGRRLDNPKLHDLLNGYRTRFGQELIDKDGAPLRIARALKSGKMIALLLDQHAGRRGIRVPFFGELASTFPSAAVFARRFKIPMIPIFACREQKRLFAVRALVFDPIECDPSLPEDEDCFRMTVAYKQCLERAIRKYPGQWLWFHRRWRKGGKEPQSDWLARYALDHETRPVAT